MSDKEKRWHIGQPKYELVVNQEYWTLDEGADYLARYNLKAQRWGTKEAADKAHNDTFNQIFESVKRSVLADKLAIKRAYFEEYDDFNEPYRAVDYIASKVTPFNLIIWALKNKLSMPHVFKEMVFNFLKVEFQQWEHQVEKATDVPQGVADEKVEGGTGIDDRTKILQSEKNRALIGATIAAVSYCLDNEQGNEVSSEEVLSYLELKGFSDINESTKHDLFAMIPKDIRVAAMPLGGKERQDYGMLKQQKEKLAAAIRAAVDAAIYVSGFQPDKKISDDEMYNWLYTKGYKDITKRQFEQIWQSLPGKVKNPPGVKNNKHVKK